jgi:hypothetical protein
MAIPTHIPVGSLTKDFSNNRFGEGRMESGSASFSRYVMCKMLGALRAKKTSKKST